MRRVRRPNLPLEALDRVSTSMLSKDEREVDIGHRRERWEKIEVDALPNLPRRRASANERTSERGLRGSFPLLSLYYTKSKLNFHSRGGARQAGARREEATQAREGGEERRGAGFFSAPLSLSVSLSRAFL